MCLLKWSWSLGFVPLLALAVRLGFGLERPHVAERFRDIPRSVFAERGLELHQLCFAYKDLETT